MLVNISVIYYKKIDDVIGQTHTVQCSCGHKFKIDDLQEGEVREITCPNCKAKRRIGKMQIGKLD
ncbi:MAG: hypothetical protein KGI11_09310 [Thaumarchaeota archaeon]|nr:hypothetical protein [Nitrososphaerota archaeon]